jgi:hypothetical protein
MSRAGNAAVALLVAAVALIVAAWFDSSVLPEAVRRAQSQFDGSQVTPLLSLGSVAVAGCVLLVAVLGWRSRSTLVGAVYAIVGIFFAFLPWIVSTFATSRNDTPSILPEALAIAVGQVYAQSAGRLNAVTTIGAAMLVVGVLVVARSRRSTTAEGAYGLVFGPGRDLTRP